MKIGMIQYEPVHAAVSPIPALIAFDAQTLGHRVEFVGVEAVADRRSAATLLTDVPDLLLLDGTLHPENVRACLEAFPTSVPMLLGRQGIRAFEQSGCLALLLDSLRSAARQLFGFESLDFAHSASCHEGNGSNRPSRIWSVGDAGVRKLGRVPHLLFRADDPGLGVHIVGSVCHGTNHHAHTDAGSAASEGTTPSNGDWLQPFRALAPRRPNRPGHALAMTALPGVELLLEPSGGATADQGPRTPSVGTQVDSHSLQTYDHPTTDRRGTSRKSPEPPHYAASAWPILHAAARPLLPPPGPMLDTHRNQWRSRLQHSPQADPTTERILDQVRQWYRLGTRRFVIDSPDPWRPLLAAVQRLDGDSAEGVRFEVTSSLASLRLEERTIRSLALEVADRGIRVEITGLLFPGFHDRILQWLAPGFTHWDLRWSAGFLQSLDREFAGPHFTATQGHRLILFDPWSTLSELDETLAAIDEEAAFLRPAVSLAARLPLPHPYDDVSQRIREAGLLEETHHGADRFRFADPELDLFTGIAANGVAPIFEALGRLRIGPRDWPSIQAQAMFRWFRELSAAVRDDPRIGSTWGRVVAKVVQDLETDRPGPSIRS